MAKRNIDKVEDIKKGILTKEEIVEYHIIQIDNDQFSDEKCYSNASYDFRIGNEYYIPNESNNNIDELKPFLSCPYKKDMAKESILDCKNENNVLRIKPFTSIVFSTYEKVSLPNNVVGRFDLMVKWALQGLILQVGTQIEPGYKGRLFGLLHNFSKKEICIPTSSRLLTAEFSYTSKDAPPIQKNGKEDKPIETLQQFLSFYPVIDGTLENFLKKIQEISDKMEKTKIKMDEGYSKLLEGNRYKFTVFVGIATVFLSVLLSFGLASYFSRHSMEKDDYPFQKVYDMENENKNMYLKMDSLLYKNKQTSDTLILMRKRINELEKKN